MATVPKSVKERSAVPQATSEGGSLQISYLEVIPGGGGSSDRREVLGGVARNWCDDKLWRTGGETYPRATVSESAFVDGV